MRGLIEAGLAEAAFWLSETRQTALRLREGSLAASPLSSLGKLP